MRRRSPASSPASAGFSGDAVLVAHNARFDQSFLERQLQWHEARRLAEPPLCTAALARRLLEGRLRRVSLASLAHFFGVPTRPCHRALPDAQCTAEVLIHLVGWLRRSAPADSRTCKRWRRRASVACTASARSRTGRLPGPACICSATRHEQVLYVGRARDLRARLRSYFRSERQRPSVEAALLALDRIEWRALGSEFEAALEEVRLIRELQPPANSRSRRSGAGRLPETPGRGLRRHEDADRARADR